MLIELLNTENEELWDHYACKHPEATIFHLIACRDIISDQYGFQPFYFMAKQGDSVQGILPLFLVKGLVSGKRLISIPFSVYGGVCADSIQIEKKLIGKAVEEADRLNVNYLECRHLIKKENPLQTKITYTTFFLDLSRDIDVIFKGFRKSLRRQINKSMDHNFKIDFSSKDIQSFYQFYSKCLKRFGTPVQSFGWFHALFTRFPDSHFIAQVKLENKVIAAFLMRKYKGVVSEIVGNDLPEYRYLNPNLYLQWKLIEYSWKNHYRTYDFGRSIKTSGTYHFKLGWGAVPHKMYYQYYVRRGRIPDLSQSNSKRILFSKFWRYLPLGMANTLGPVIRNRYP